MGARPLLKKTAVVLLNLGGPSSLAEVKPFLLSLFSDPAILHLSNPFRFILAYFLMRRRLRKAQQMYSLLGGGSPLLENTKAQAVALEKELGPEFRVFVAMRHAPPFAYQTLEDVKAYDPAEVILLPLFPHYSTTTTESSFKAWQKSARHAPFPTQYISSYPAQEGFVEAMKKLTLPLYQKALKYGRPKVLLTAHSLPEKIIQRGDPYQDQVEQTTKKFVETLGLSPLDFTLCYQSQMERLKWIGPSTKEEIVKGAQDKRPLVVIPISFVSEHAETLVELDITYRQMALELGCPAYYRVETAQIHPSFIKGLAALVKKRGKYAF